MSNETQADIIADMRKFVDDTCSNPQCETMKLDAPEIACRVEAWACRIEAAVERERTQRDKVSFRCGDCARFGGDCDAGDSDGNEDRVACEEFVRRALVPGNAAAMRAALTGVAENLALHIQCGRLVAPGDHVSFPISEAEAYIRDIRAALAKPARSCDKENCAWDAQVEFRRTFRDAYGNPAPSGDDPAYWGLFVNWLFAPAEGKEASNG